MQEKKHDTIVLVWKSNDELQCTNEQIFDDYWSPLKKPLKVKYISTLNIRIQTVTVVIKN